MESINVIRIGIFANVGVKHPRVSGKANMAATRFYYVCEMEGQVKRLRKEIVK